jgi:hypothetical protein
MEARNIRPRRRLFLFHLPRILSTSRADLDARNFLAAATSGFLEDFAISGPVMECWRKPYHILTAPAKSNRLESSLSTRYIKQQPKGADERQTKMNWLLYGYFLCIVLQKQVKAEISRQAHLSETAEIA